MEDRKRATKLLSDICEGEATATSELFEIVYDQLRGVASDLLQRERADHTLQATALVHEAYLRLVNLEQFEAEGEATARRNFVALAARAMRRILIDHARGRGREKRGGERRRVTLDESVEMLPTDATSLLDLESALVKLDEVDPRMTQAAELRLFGGLSVQELAPCMDLSLSRAKVVWASTRALLSKLLADAPD